MGRSRKSFERFIGLLRFRDLAMRLTYIPGLKHAGRLVIKPSETTLTYIPVCEELELPPGAVAPTSVIETFIREASDHLILSVCPCRSQAGCREHPADFGCTFLGPAVREVDPAVGRRVSMEEALEHLWEATERGLVSCLGHFRFDAVMLGVRDYHRLMTICHCCQCCCLSNGLPLAAPDARDLLVRLEGLTVEVTDNCNGCGLCVEACVFGQIRVEDGRAVVGTECKGCGRCAAACRRGGVSIRIEDPAYIEACMSRISSMVDIG